MSAVRRSLRIQRTPSPNEETAVVRSKSEGKSHKRLKSRSPPQNSCKGNILKNKSEAIIDLVPSPSKSGRISIEYKQPNYKVDMENIEPELCETSESEAESSSSSSRSSSATQNKRVTRMSSSEPPESTCTTPRTPVRRASTAKRVSQTTPRRRLPSKKDNLTPLRAKKVSRLPNLLDTIPETKAISCRTPVKLSAKNCAYKNKMKCLTSPVKRRRNDSKNDFELLRDALSHSRLPAELPCREKEFEAVKDFLVQNLKNETSRSIYISGVPGTGKTATVKQVLRSLQKDKSYDLKLIEVSGMRVTDPNQIFTEIHFQLFDGKERLSANKAARTLDRVFELADMNRPSTILLVDELDLLCTRKQHVLYQLFEWATRNEARLSIIAIANTLDLPERLLTQRVASRLGMARLCFQPYNHTEIGEILASRLGGSAVVESEAVELVSRKVASVSGDLRKALQICRRAIDMAIVQKETRLTLSLVQQAVKDLGGNSRCISVQSCSRHEQIFLQAAVREFTQFGREETQLNYVYPLYMDQCRFEAIKPLNIEQTCILLARLGALRLINIEDGRHDFTRKVRLCVPAEEIQFALRIAN